MDSSRIYELGGTHFRLANYVPELASQIEALFPLAQSDPTGGDVITLDLADFRDVRSMIDHLLRLMPERIWIAAATLISPANKILMLCGRPSSGKTSLTAILAFKYRWRIIAEDVTLIDYAQNELVSLQSPLSMKPGACARWCRLAGVEEPPMLFNEWIPTAEHAARGRYPAHFDAAVMLSRFEAEERTLELQQLPRESFVSSLLQLSNIIHKPQSAHLISEYLADASCATLHGGNLSERLTAVIELCG